MILEATKTLILIVGAAGTPEYGEAFATWAERWELAAEEGGFRVVRIGADAADGSADDNASATDRERLLGALGAEPRSGEAPLWVVFLGHGTWDGSRARINLRGPDVRADELSDALESITRPTATVVCAASSSPFLNALSHANRVVVTATKSGSEYSFSRFGEYLSRAIGGRDADLDKDGQVSLHEAFLQASAQTAAFYDSETRLATEHPLLDDNGDGFGTPASWFRGVRATKTPTDGRLPDGVYAHRFHLVESSQVRSLPVSVKRKRDQLEAEVEALRLRRDQWSEDEYYARLEVLMIALARLSRRAALDQDHPPDQNE